MMNRFSRCLSLAAILAVAIPPQGFSQPQAWVASPPGHVLYGTPRARNVMTSDARVALDRLGNSYLTGSSGDHWITRKYDATGVERWATVHAGPGQGVDAPIGVVTDEAGNTFVTGVVTYVRAVDGGTISGIVIATAKYDSTGTEVWSREYDGPYHTVFSNPCAIALDHQGNVIVAGTTNGMDVDDFVTLKYDADGNLLWSRLCPGSFQNWASDLIIDADDNIYVTGPNGCGAGMYNLTVKYSPDGTEVWTRGYMNETCLGYDVGDDIALDPSGDPVIATTIHGERYSLVKYSPAGNRLTSVTDYTHDDFDFTTDVGTDGAGNAYVTGYSTTSRTEYDFLTEKIGAGGSILWSDRYNGPEGKSRDMATSLQVDAYGRPCVAGRSGGGIAVIVYGTDGSRQALIRYDDPQAFEPVPSATFPLDMAVNAGSDLLVTAGNREFFTAKYAVPPPSAGWERQTSGTTAPLWGVSFAGPLIGWVVGGRGTILKTTDAGSHWQRQSQPGPQQDLRAVDAVDANTVYACGDLGELLKTTDGGATWTVLKNGGATWTTANLQRIHFTSYDTGWATGRRTILQTTDGGVTWSALTPDALPPMNDLYVVTRSKFIGVANSSIMMCSSDAGSTWTAWAGFPRGKNLRSLAFSDSLHGWVVGDKGSLFVTTNGGSTWVKNLGAPASRTFLHASFSPNGIGAAVGKNGRMIFLQPGGSISGTITSTGVAGTLNDISCLDYTEAWAVGAKGLIVHFTPSPSPAFAGRGPSSEGTPQTFVLGPNYPNPFNPTTMIRFTLAEASVVCLRVYNTLGQEVAVLAADDEFPEGENEIEFDASTLSSGVYYYALTVEGVEKGSSVLTATRRMLLVR